MNETTERQIQRMGWELESLMLHGAPAVYRASCGGFSTPYRESQIEVRADVGAIKSRENSQAVGPQKARWA